MAGNGLPASVKKSSEHEADVQKDIAILSDFSGEVDSSLTYCPLIKTGIYLGNGHIYTFSSRV